MSRIPTWEELAGSGPRAARGAVSGNTGAEAIGAGVKQIGSALGAIGADITEKDNIDDVLKADDYHLNARTDLVRSFDNDSDYGTFQPRARVGLDEVTGNAAKMIRNPEMRKKWLARATRENVSSIDQVTRMGDARAREDGQARLGDVLDSYTTQYLSPDLDDAAKADVLRNMDARIGAAEKQGLVRPLVGRKLREQYLGAAVSADYENRLIKDPEAVIKELENLPATVEPKQYKGAAFHPDVEDAIDQASKETGLSATTLRAFFKIESGGNPKARTGSYKGLGQLSNEEWRKYGGRGDIYDAQENAVVTAKKLKAESADFEKQYGRAPTASELYMIHQQGTAGAAAHFSNPDAPAWENMHSTAEGRQKGAGWAKQAIWGNIPDKDKARFGTVDNVTSQDFTDLWASRVDKLAGGSDAPTQVADATGDTVAKSDLPPIGSGRAELLSPKQRLHLLDKARAALSADLTDKVNKDIIRIKAGEEPEKDDQGLTAIDKAEKLMKSGAAYQGLRVKWEKAKAEREAIAPMEHMSEDEALDHIAGLKKSPWLQKAANDAWKSQMKLRDEDPASMVIADNQVKAAAAVAQKRAASVGLQMDDGGNLVIQDMPGTVDPGNRQAAIGPVLDSRLQAQASRGMPDYAQRIITRREAKNLLQIDSPTGMDDRKYRAALEAAAQRALDWYGPEYGKRALEEAISFQRGSRTNDKKRFEDKLLAGIAAGEGVSQSDIRKYNEVSRTSDMMSREFQLQDPAAADDTRPYIGQPLQPSPQHVDWLKKNISDPAAIATFDGKFGEGAAARALYAGQDAKTTASMGLKQPPKPQKSVLQMLFGN